MTPHTPRLTLRPDLATPDGEPRVCLALPGRPLPLAFPNLAAALAALRDMEARTNGR